MARDEDLHRQRAREYHAAHRDERNAQMRAWRQVNRGQVRQARQSAEYREGAAARSLRWREEHPRDAATLDAERDRRRRQMEAETPEARAARLAAAERRKQRWRLAHPLRNDAIRAANNANLRARALGLARITAIDVEALWARQPACVDCGEGHGLDHILALADGGTNSPDNLQNLCHQCNRRKEGRRMTEAAAARR
jgi:5-methylcytosine-specific restriction endonuclease McrA